MKTAIIIGATGVTGAPLTRMLLESAQYSKVIAFSRNPLGIDHEKLENHIVDFDLIDSWKPLVKGDDLFSAMGTTLRQAGSQEAQYRIDYTYQAEVARVARENGVLKTFSCVFPRC